MIVPCKGCQERELGCHCRCSKYKAYKTELEGLNKKGRLRYDADQAGIDGRRRMDKAKHKAPRSVRED